MRRQTSIGVVFLLHLALPLAAEAAPRTFVSATSGNDANACTRPAPCRSFTAAILQTDPGGEVVALDSGGYGPFSIHQSLSVIVPEGIHGAITSAGGGGIFISAGTSDAVILRGLRVNGLGANAHGILFAAGGALTIEDCIVEDFALFGIFRQAASRLTVIDSVSRRNQRGISDSADAPTEPIHVFRSVLEQNDNNGFSVFNQTLALIRDSYIFSNGGFGVLGSSLDAGPVLVVVENTTISANGTGLHTAGTLSEISVSGSTITFNVLIGVSGNVHSRGNNTFRYNGGSFAGTFAPQ